MDKIGVLRFVDAGTLSIEAETGMGINESANRATNMAIEAAVVEMIREGQKKGFWDYDSKSVEEIRLAEEAKKKAKEEAQFLNRLKNTLSRTENNDAVGSKTDDSQVTIKTGESQ
jgi:D-ribose pyranose/furanose isomerase RbsD